MSHAQAPRRSPLAGGLGVGQQFETLTGLPEHIEGALRLQLQLDEAVQEPARRIFPADVLAIIARLRRSGLALSGCLTWLPAELGPGVEGSEPLLVDLSRDHISEGWEHSLAMEEALDLDGPEQRFEAARLATGLSFESLSKLRLEERTGAGNRRAHYAAVTMLAPRLAELLELELTDVDSKYDVSWPSKSDVSLLHRDRSQQKALAVLVDVHQGPHQPEKLLALALQSLLTLGSGVTDVLAMTLQVTMDPGRWEPSPLQPAWLQSELHFSLAAPALIGELVEASTTSELEDLSAVLEQTVGGEVQASIMSEYNGALEDEAWSVEAKKLLHHAAKATAVEGDQLLELLRYRSPGIIRTVQELKSLADDLKLERMSKLLDLPGKGVWLDSEQAEMRSAPPLAIAEKTIRDRYVRALIGSDPLLKGVFAVQTDLAPGEKGYHHGVAIDPWGRVIPIPGGEEPQFDVRQDHRTRFAAGILAYVRRPREPRTYYRNRQGGEQLTLNNLPREHRLMTLIELRKLYEIDEVWSYAPHVQVLINNAIYRDERLETFLHRGFPQANEPLHTGALPSASGPRFESMVGNEVKFEEYVDACVPDVQLAARMCNELGSMSGKVAMLMSRLAVPAIRGHLQQVRGLLENHLMTYYDYEAQKARSVAIALNSRTPENCASVIRVPSYAGAVFTYLNSEASHFRTTWMKDVVLTAAPAALLRHCDLGEVFDMTQSDSLGRPMRLAAVPLGVAPGELGFQQDRTLLIVAGKFHSRNRRDLDWSIERSAKAVVRAASLIEMRGSLYSQDPVRFQWDRPRTYQGAPFARRELIVNLTGFHESSQQNSVSQTAQRYLHQAMGSLDNDPLATLSKLSGIRLRGCSRIASHAMMSSVYCVATVLRMARGPDFLMSGTGEVAVLMPDLMRASSLAQLNVSCYATPNQMNVEKPNGTQAEALDVQAVWDNNAKVRALETTHPHLRHGIAAGTADALISSARLGQWRTVAPLTAWVRENSDLVVQNCRDIAALPRGTQLCSCMFFEVLAHLRLRLEIGQLDPLSSLSGQSLNSLFTTAGSFRCGSFKPSTTTLFRVEPLRKAAAIASVVAEVSGLPQGEDQMARLARLGQERPYLLVDLYQVLLGMSSGKVSCEPLGRGTDKNAPGKNREITTLEAGFGLKCVGLERLHMALSSSTPEDLIMTRDKDLEVTRRLALSQRQKREDDSVRIFYVNRDMSAHGPTHKSCSSAVTVAILAPDRETRNFGVEVVAASLRKKWLYPEGLVQQAIQTHGLDPESGLKRVPESLAQDQQLRNLGPTRTGSVMKQIERQFTQGSADGPKGSVWAEVADGMPGQGIFSIQASVSHAAIARLASRLLQQWLGWSLETVINSDDSMVILRVLATVVLVVRLALRRCLARFIMFGGLCENEGKLTPTTRRPEVVSNFYNGMEPVAQVFKFSNALTQLRTTGSLADDLLSAASRGADAMKAGDSAYMASVVAAANMALVLDAHRSWGRYAASLVQGRTKGSFTLLDLYPEEGGLPALSPQVAVLSGLGPRLASYAALSEDDALDQAYCRYLISSLFEPPLPHEDSAATDIRRGAVVGDNYVLYSASGAVDAVLPRPLQTPQVDGLSVKLRRPKGSLRLARQLGPQLAAFPELRLDANSTLAIGPLLSKVIRGLRRPLEEGDEPASAVLQVGDLSHARGMRCLRCLEMAPLAAVLGSRPVSPLDLESALQVPGALEKIRSRFVERLSRQPAVSLELSGLFSSLVERAAAILRFARDLARAHVENDSASLGLAESEYGRYRPRTVLRRNFDLGLSDGLQLDRREVERTFLARSLRPGAEGDLPVGSRRLLGAVEATGGHTALEACEISEMMTDRLLANLPGRYKVSSLVRARSSHKEDLIDDWIRLNFTYGHRAVWPGGGAPEEALHSALSNAAARTLPDSVAAAAAHYHSSKLSADLSGCQLAVPRPLGSGARSIHGVSQLVRGAGDALLAGVRPLHLVRAHPELLAAANVQFRLSARSLGQVLEVASRSGWVSSEGAAYRVTGPIANWPLGLGESAEAYLAQSRVWDLGGTVWSHTLVWSGPSPRDLRDVEWAPSVEKAYLAPLKDSLALALGGNQWPDRVRRRPSGFSSSGRALTTTDLYRHRRMAAGDLYQLVSAGHYYALQPLNMGANLLFPYLRDAQQRAPLDLPSPNPRASVASPRISLPADVPLQTCLPPGDPHRLGAAKWSALARARVSQHRRSDNVGAVVATLRVVERLLETLGESTGPLEEIEQTLLPRVDRLSSDAHQREQREAALDWAAGQAQRTALSRAQLADRARRLVASQTTAANPRLLAAAELHVALQESGLVDLHTISDWDERQSAPSAALVSGEVSGQLPPRVVGDWADEDEGTQQPLRAAHETGQPSALREDESVGLSSSRARVRGPGIVQLLERGFLAGAQLEQLFPPRPASFAARTAGAGPAVHGLPPLGGAVPLAEVDEEGEDLFAEAWAEWASER